MIPAVSVRRAPAGRAPRSLRNAIVGSGWRPKVLGDPERFTNLPADPLGDGRVEPLQPRFGDRPHAVGRTRQHSCKRPGSIRIASGVDGPGDATAHRIRQKVVVKNRPDSVDHEGTANAVVALKAKMGVLFDERVRRRSALWDTAAEEKPTHHVAEGERRAV